jgi:transcription elongation GreA/GreB family factor
VNIVINTVAVWQGLFSEFSRLISLAKAGADRAHATATNVANVAENKHDTLGLEAAYLAQGQQQRLAQCIEDNALFDELYKKRIDEPEQVGLGGIITLKSDSGQRCVLLGPSAGGLKVVINEVEVLVITPKSPLGGQLMGKELDDEVRLKIGDNDVCYDIIAIYYPCHP